MLASSASEAGMPNIDSTKDADLALSGCQAEIEPLAVKNEERKARRVHCKQAVREREYAKQGLGFLLEGPKHPQHSPNEGYRELKLPHFESKDEIEEISLRELPAAASATSVANVGDHDLLFAQVDELVLGDAQGFGSLSQSKRHDRYYLPLLARKFKIRLWATYRRTAGERTISASRVSF